ncbi:MAG: hypothetical protein H0U00_06260 [Actinobacteria bacterium]|nr:hypothetical protein [Actinomycetota bacterium]
MRRLWRENGLSIVTLALFLLFVGGQTAAGWHDYNQDQEEHGQPALGYVEYLGSGHSIEALSENAESEFLQMGLFVWLTTFLRQKGSPESKALGPEEVDKDPRRNRERGSPWPVQRGGLALTLYENSLTLVFLALFLVAFSVHAMSGAASYSEEQLAHGGEAVSALQYLATSRMWFESLQNWQSEMLAVLSLVVLSIYLRQRGSPESKPVASPNSRTGSS